MIVLNLFKFQFLYVSLIPEQILNLLNVNFMIFSLILQISGFLLDVSILILEVVSPFTFKTFQKLLYFPMSFSQSQFAYFRW